MQRTMYDYTDPGLVVSPNNAQGCECASFGSDPTKAPKEVWLWLAMAFSLGLLLGK